jgi:phosphatidylinositol alpha-1,6-mannosyltransferase
MRCLLIARNLPPLIGGIENMMATTVRATPDIEWVVIGPKGCTEHLPPHVTCYEAPSKTPLFLVNALLLVIKACRKNPFDWVIGSNGGMAPLVKIGAWLSKARSFIFLHGKDIVMRNVFYRIFFWSFVTRANVVSVNSNNTRELAIDRGIRPDKLVLLHPCIQPRELPDKELDGDSSRPAILYAGRIVPRKGLKEWLEVSHGWLKQNHLTLWIAGDEPSGQSLGVDTQYLQSILRLIDARQLNEHVRFWGRLPDLEVNQLMSKACVQLMPLVPTDDDIEGFGMVVIEAALLGTPTVAFEVGGVVDAVGRQEDLISPGDYEKFNARLLHYADDLTLPTSDLENFGNQFLPGPYATKLLSVLE